MNGTYQFIVTIMNKYQDDVYGKLMVNGVSESISYAGQAKLQMGMATTVVHLNAGDQVWIEKGQHGSGHMYRQDYTSFSGHLIHADM